MDKQSMPTTGISLERATDRTLEPAQVYRVQHDTLIGSFATRRKAEQAYHAAIAARGAQPPVLRSDDQKGFVVLPRRWVVERTLAWLTQCRRLSKEYEGLPASSEAMIYLAMTRLMIRRLATT